jgi:hypothetical protein
MTRLLARQVARLLARLLGALGAVGVSVVAAAAPAAGQNARMTVSPTTVRAGGVVTARSVDTCQPPPNTPGGSPFVRVTVNRGGATLGSGRAPVQANGSWSATVRVSANARAGAAEVQAFCFFSEQAEGALEAYAPVAIRITRGSAAADDSLPRTGRATAPMTAAGLGLVGLGMLLLSWAGRPRGADA